MRSAGDSWPRDALPKGTVLYGYTIDGVLGRGGFGITYRAVDSIDQFFAIKECFPRQFAVRLGADVLPADAAEAEPFADCLARFTKEARALTHLSKHGAAGDGVVKVMTFFQTNGTAYIVMEYLRGQSLDALIKSSPGGIGEARLRDILHRLLPAIAAVHEAGLVHRDIKPANILLHEDGRPVLIDFGAARGASHGQTVTFTQILSEGYGPIEQYSGTRQGPYSDIYALGATLYRAIGGTTVDAFTRHQAVLAGKSDPLLPAVQVGADRYSPELLRAIDAALAIAPEARPQSAQAMLALLSAAAEGDTKIVSAAAALAVTGARDDTVIDGHTAATDRTVVMTHQGGPMAAIAPPPAHRRVGWIAAASLLALVVFGGAALLASQWWEARRAAEQHAVEAAEEARLAAKFAERKRRAEENARNEAAEDAARLAAQRAARQAQEALAVERAAKETAERAARLEGEKLAAERAAREAAEKAAHETAERQRAQKLADEAAARDAAQRFAAEKAANDARDDRIAAILREADQAFAKRDYADAMKLYRKAADQGNAAAQAQIGFLFHEGRGVAVDFVAALWWYRKAAEQGNAVAQGHIGSIYQNGQGVAVDYAEAMRWYRKAADQGNAAAQTQVGYLYHEGKGVPRDLNQAKIWFQKAAAGGNEAAKRWLATY